MYRPFLSSLQLDAEASTPRMPLVKTFGHYQGNSAPSQEKTVRYCLALADQAPPKVASRFVPSRTVSLEEYSAERAERDAYPSCQDAGAQ
jgi:hypothetical protein